ncbi:PIN domain-containing protein [Streptomyces atratus]|uniref:PIN domain-containing protein n=1 Tax=Streptomyces atratus TaxID=1893 RepID=UPI002254D126|nr:PIN domain-containing protein [Streptomyces atratus]MCX5342517.1 PIN domain-containing protein [Streptomyces atratus]
MAARVFVDTNVLFPFSVMDVMLSLTEDAIHEIVWSERLLGEWERVIVREGKRSAKSAAAVAQAVRRFFPDCEIGAAVMKCRVMAPTTGITRRQRWRPVPTR